MKDKKFNNEHKDFKLKLSHEDDKKFLDMLFKETTIYQGLFAHTLNQEMRRFLKLKIPFWNRFLSRFLIIGFTPDPPSFQISGEILRGTVNTSWYVIVEE